MNFSISVRLYILQHYYYIYLSFINNARLYIFSITISNFDKYGQQCTSFLICDNMELLTG